MTKEIYHHQGENLPPETQHDQQSISEENLNNYWRANLGLLAKLLSVWFVVSFGCGILLADWLDQFSFFGFKLGFWFAQQGAIYVLRSASRFARDLRTTKSVSKQFGSCRS